MGSPLYPFKYLSCQLSFMYNSIWLGPKEYPTFPTGWKRQVGVIRESWSHQMIKEKSAKLLSKIKFPCFFLSRMNLHWTPNIYFQHKFYIDSLQGMTHFAFSLISMRYSLNSIVWHFSKLPWTPLCDIFLNYLELHFC